jgi:hypothetical protein
MRSKLPNNAFLNFNLMIDLLVTRMIMRPKPKNIIREFWSHDQSVNLLINIIEQIWSHEKVEFQSHEIRPHDQFPFMLVWIGYLLVKRNRGVLVSNDTLSKVAKNHFPNFVFFKYHPSVCSWVLWSKPSYSRHFTTLTLLIGWLPMSL